MSATINPATFWSHVEKGDECWLWTGGTYSGKPHCLFRFPDGRTLQHPARVACALLGKDVPKLRKTVLTCGNTACVNPSHVAFYRGVGGSEHHRRWVAKNKDYVRAYHRKWEAKNRDQVRAKQRQWYAANREKVSRWTKDRAARNPEHAHAKRVNAKTKRRGYGLKSNLRAADMAALVQRDKKCYLCGKRNTRATRSVDHVVPLSRGGKHEFTNLRLVHLTGNLKKRDKIILLPLEAAS